MWISIALLGLAAPLTPPERADVLHALAGLSSDLVEARAHACLIAGNLHRPLFVQPLIEKIDAPEALVRESAAIGLGELGVPSTSKDLFDLIGALFKASTDPDPEVAVAAIRALARYPFPEVRMRLEHMASDLKTPTHSKQAALEALKHADPEVKARMIAWLELAQREAQDHPTPDTEGDELIRAARDLLSANRDHGAAVRAIAAWPKVQERIPFLRRALAEKDTGVRRTAAQSLAAIKDLDAAKALAAGAADDPDTSVRRAAIEGMAKQRDSVLTTKLVLRFKDEKDWELRKLLATAIAGQDEGAALNALATIDGRSADNVRDQAIELVAAKTATRAAEVLVRYLIDAKHADTAERAQRHLANRSDAQVVPALLASLEVSGRDSPTRGRVIAALSKRSAEEIAKRVLEIIAHGRGDASVVALVQGRPEAREGLLKLVGEDDAKVRFLALSGVQGMHGEDVLAALSAVVEAHAEDDRAFQLLLMQQDQDLLDPLLALLVSKKHAQHHLQIIDALHGKRDARIAAPVGEAAFNAPELAPSAIEILKAQDARRALPVLARLAGDKQLKDEVRAAATSAMAELAGVGEQSSSETNKKTNEKTPQLADLAPNAVESPVQEISASDATNVESLPSVSESIEALIKPLAKDPAVDVRSAARNALHRLDPGRYPKWDPYGRVPLVVEAGGFGAAMMLVAGDLADAQLSPAFTGAVGLVLGGATPFLLTLNEDVTLGDAGYFGTVGLYGTLGAWGLAGAFHLSDQNTRWATLGGEILGVSIAGLTMKSAEWSLDEVALTNVSALEAGVSAAAMAALYQDLRGRRQDNARYVGLAASALATVPIALFARHLEVDDHLLTMATLMAHGAFLGSFVPGIADSDGYSGSRAATAIVVGQGAGYFAGLVLAQLGDTTVRGTEFSLLGATTGAALFGGAGLAFEKLRGRPAFALAEAGAALGALSMFIAEKHIELHDNDTEVIAFSTIGGAIAGGQFSVRLEEHTFGESSFPGGVLLGAGAGFAGGLLLSQLVDLDSKSLYGTLGGGALLGVTGIGLGYLIPELGVRPRSTITSAFIGGGLALTAPFANQLKLSDPALGYLTLAMLTTGFTGAFLPIWSHDEDADLPAREVAGGAVFGAGLGAAAAIAAAQLLDFKAADLGVVTMGTAAGFAIGAGSGLMATNLDRRGSFGLLQGGTLLGLVGTTILAKGTAGLSAGREDLLAEYAGAFALQGTVHGTLVPALWRGEGRQYGGGALLGAGGGAVLGALVLQLSDQPLDTLDMAEASVYAFTADGMAAGLGLLLDSPRLGVGLAEGLGLGAFAASLVLAPRTHFQASDASTMLLGTAAFGVLGGFVPYVLEKNPQSARISGGAMFGATTGLLGSAIYVQLADRREDLETATTFAAAGSAAGGLKLVVPELDDKTAAIIFEGAGALALAGSIAFAPSTTYGDGDYALIAALSTLGAWHGGWIPPLRRPNGRLDQKEIGGGALFGAGTGMLAGMVLSQFVEPDPGDVAEMFLLSTAFAGTGAGLELALPDSSRKSGALAVELGGAIGLGLTALAAPYTTYSDEDLTLIALLQSAGALHGIPIARTWSEHPSDVMIGGGALLGAGSGLLAGTLISQFGDVAFDDQLESVFFLAAGDALGGGLALFREDNPGREGVLAFELGGLGMLGAGLLLAPHTQFDDADKVFVGLGTTLGAWHGAFLPLVFGQRSSLDHRQEIGGALLGAGAGALVAGGISQLVTLDADDQAEGALAWTMASMIGGGAGLMSRSLDQRGKALLVEGTGLAGLTAGLLLSDALKLEGDGDYALLPFGAALGAALGATLPIVAGRQDPRDEELGGGALLGAGAFAAGALLLSQISNYEGSDVAELGSWTLAGSGIGAGLALMIPGSTKSERYALMNGGALLALAGSLAFAPLTNISEDDFTTLGVTAAIGAAMGAASPGLWNETVSHVPPEQIGGGLLFGTAVGLGSGLLLSQTVGVDAKARRYAALGASMGALSGMGIGILSADNDRVPIALAEGLTLAGALGVAASAGAIDFNAGDFAFGSAYVGYLSWHTLGLTLLLDGTDRQAAGAVMATIGLGAATGMYLSPYIHLDLSKVLMLFAGNVWGTWIGGWGGAILRKHVDTVEGRKSTGLTLMSTVLGSDLGLAVTGMVVGGLLDVEPTRFAVVNLSGLGGMMLGMLVAGFAKGEPLKEGNVIGSLSGLVLGAVVTSFIDFKSTPTWDELLAPTPPAKPASAAETSPTASGSVKLVEIDTWFPSAQVEPTGDGDERYVFSILGTWR